MYSDEVIFPLSCREAFGYFLSTIYADNGNSQSNKGGRSLQIKHSKEQTIPPPTEEILASWARKCTFGLINTTIDFLKRISV